MAIAEQANPWARGVGVFAGVVLIVGGVLEVLESISALVNDKYLVVLPNYVYSVDLTVWGWIHLIIGLGLAAIGVFLLLGRDWARIGGLVVAAISAIINFTWLPYAPWWALVLIALDLLIIWALASLVRAPAPQPPVHPVSPSRATPAAQQPVPPA
jgi:hypothetical protein